MTCLAIRSKSSRDLDISSHETRDYAEVHEIDYYETKKWSGARWSRDINIPASELKGRF